MPGAHAGQNRRRARRSAWREVDADLRHQRARDRRGAAGPLFRSGYPAGDLPIALVVSPAVNGAAAEPFQMAAARSRHATGVPGFRIRCLPRFCIEDLTKDYWVGFWRKRPCRRSSACHSRCRQRGSSAFSVRTARERPRRSAWYGRFPVRPGGRRFLGRPVGDVSSRQRIVAGESLLLRLSDRRRAPPVLCEAVRLFQRGCTQARGNAPRPRGPRRTAATAAPQMLEGHDPARRHCAGAPERPGSRLSGRTHVGPRPARPPRRALADPGAARSGAHGVLQLAHPRRRRGDVQPRCRGCRRPASLRQAANDILAFQVHGWELVIDNLQPEVLDRIAPQLTKSTDIRPLRARSAARRVSRAVALPS